VRTNHDDDHHYHFDKYVKLGEDYMSFLRYWKNPQHYQEKYMGKLASFHDK
jgi:hypothetical protein